MKLTHIIFYMTLLFLMAAPLAAEDTSQSKIRSRAQKAYTDGNWQDAFELYRRLSMDPRAEPKIVGRDFTQAWQCLRQLDRLDELDDFREAVIEQHAANWLLLLAAARSYSQNTHWGYMIAGEFKRGHHRGGGKYVNAVARDRVRALQLLQQAMAPAESDRQKAEVAQFYLEFARTVQQHRGTAHQAWRLQYLTDLTRLPDYEPGYGHGYGGRIRYAPVDALGRPVYHRIPKDYDTAASDGERWRWLLARAVTLHPALEAGVEYTWATFLHRQFGVQTLADYGILYGRGRPLDKTALKIDESGAYAVHTLSDDETIARLAVGVRRFELPAEYNFIHVFNKILESNNGQAANASRALAQIYENRRQYDRAVQYWQVYKKSNRSAAQKRIDQIIKNWGVFESGGMQPASATPRVEYRFRNGRRVAFSAHRIRVKRLLEDVKAYIRTENRRLD